MLTRVFLPQFRRTRVLPSASSASRLASLPLMSQSSSSSSSSSSAARSFSDGSAPSWFNNNPKGGPFPLFSTAESYPLRRVVRASSDVYDRLVALPPQICPGAGIAPQDEETQEKLLEFARAEAALKIAIDLCGEKDLGLPDSAWDTPPEWVKAIPVYEDKKMSIRLFIVPPYQTVPLHDHPGMLVFSRLLRGEMHAYSLSWCDELGHPKVVGYSQPWPSAKGDPGPFIAKCDFKSWMSAPKATETVYPSAGNLHEFHAGDKTCVFVDAFIPKYDGARVRHFYTPETLLFKPKDRLSHNPCYGPLSTEVHHLGMIEVGAIVKLRQIEDPKHYRINRLSITSNASRHL